MKKISFEHLVGKTIVSAKQKKLKDYDDKGFLELTFSDKTQVLIVSEYSSWTGDSDDEYPTDIEAHLCLDKELEDLPENQKKSE